jgi:hypothetical protein
MPTNVVVDLIVTNQKEMESVGKDLCRLVELGELSMIEAIRQYTDRIHFEVASPDAQ